MCVDLVKKKKKKKKKKNLGATSSPVRSWITARQAWFVTSPLISRKFFRQSAEVTMLRDESFVPVMHFTRRPFAFSNGKQVTVHSGPYWRTHSTRWRSR